MDEVLLVEDLKFNVCRSDRRKTISLAVDRGGGLHISAPTHCSREYIEHFIKEKRLWLYKKLQEKEQLFPPVRIKKFVSGEDFYYLGRNYRLRFVKDSIEKSDFSVLCLYRGWFLLKESERARGQEHFLRWYIDHGQPWMQKRVSLFINQVGITPYSVNVRDLGLRWGSCGHNGILNFHWRTVLLPPYIIDYIIVHELVHLQEPHHGTVFWQCMDRIMPDFVVRKQWLAKNGQRF